MKKRKINVILDYLARSLDLTLMIMGGLYSFFVVAVMTFIKPAGLSAFLQKEHIADQKLSVHMTLSSIIILFITFLFISLILVYIGKNKLNMFNAKHVLIYEQDPVYVRAIKFVLRYAGLIFVAAAIFKMLAPLPQNLLTLTQLPTEKLNLQIQDNFTRELIVLSSLFILLNIIFIYLDKKNKEIKYN